MHTLKRKWLRFENWVYLNRWAFVVVAYILFFFVFPFFVTEDVDFDAISATLP